MAAPADRTGRRAFAAVLAASAITNIAYTMPVSLVPVLTQRFAMSALAVSATFGGFALAKALAQPAGGALVDRTRRLPLLAASGLLVTAVTIGGLSLAGTGTQIVAWRLAWGVAEGLTFPPLYRLVICLAPRAGLEPERGMGRFGAVAVAGMAAGPGASGLVHAYLGFSGVFVLGAVLTCAGGLLLLALVPRDATGAATGIDRTRSRRALAPAALLLVAVFGVTDLINNAVYAALEPTLPLYLKGMYGQDAVAWVSALFTAGLIVFAIVSSYSGRLVAGARLLVAGAVGFGVAAAALLGIGISARAWLLVPCFLVFMATQPVLYIMARRGVALVPADRLGRAFGLFGLLSDTGYIIGPTLGTLAYTTWSGHGLAAGAALCALATAGCLLLRDLPERLSTSARTEVIT